MDKLKIFIVDDERILRISIADELREAGHIVFEFANATAALSLFKKESPDVIITDLKMPGIDGIEFLIRIKNDNPDTAIIMMTAYATVDTAVKAMKLGAFDYITKPFQPDEILLILQRISELKELKTENKRLRKQVSSNFEFSEFIGSPGYTEQLFDLVKRILDSKTTVLIHGETGTGKEMLTNIIHYNSNRAAKPLIKVNCAILSKEIFESELFGHVKGAFTGADKEKIGRFELANQGTLYLDDIDDIPYELQVKLLRALEEGEIERVGGTETVKVDVRLIASTKVDLKTKIKEGRFREDLFYRLNIFPIPLLPLRNRVNDIEYLMDYFYEQFTSLSSPKFSSETYEILKKYQFPGNVRELRNLVERMVLMADDQTISPGLIPFEVINYHHDMPKVAMEGKSLSEQLEEIELNAIKKALLHCKNNKTKAAELLGLPLSTLRTKMEKYKLE